MIIYILTHDIILIGCALGLVFGIIFKILMIIIGRFI